LKSARVCRESLEMMFMEVHFSAPNILYIVFRVRVPFDPGDFDVYVVQR
jgi:hypothetical protein